MTRGTVSGDLADSDPPVVDLRSDTVTRPTAGMRRAIAGAEVGDDVLGDDPSTRRLEARVAELLGKERSLFFPSGTMANQAALAALGRPGTGVVLDDRSHIVHREEGAAAALSGLQLRPVVAPDGVLTAEAVAAALSPPSRYLIPDTVVSVENTHMDWGGKIVSLETMQALGGLARERGLALHVDGARLWNTSAATGHGVAEFAAVADTVMVSLSKGLGAPVGSMLAGEGEVMAAAFLARRRFGGAMRQSGILAAAALYALDHHIERLHEDHALARQLAAGVEGIGGLHADPPDTNIVFIEVAEGGRSVGNLLKFLENRRILMAGFGQGRLRAVTHLDVDQQGIARTLAALAEAGVQT